MMMMIRVYICDVAYLKVSNTILYKTSAVCYKTYSENKTKTFSNENQPNIRRICYGLTFIYVYDQAL